VAGSAESAESVVASAESAESVESVPEESVVSAPEESVVSEQEESVVSEQDRRSAGQFSDLQWLFPDLLPSLVRPNHSPDQFQPPFAPYQQLLDHPKLLNLNHCRNIG
jgi:hypothetical protein